MHAQQTGSLINWDGFKQTLKVWVEAYAPDLLQTVID